LEKNFSRIEKVITAFSIPEKMFSKIENLICALRVHINRTLILFMDQVGLGIFNHVTFSD